MEVYSSLASWWSVLTPLGTYDMEAEFFYALLGEDIQSVMELGSGIGAMASSMPAHVHCILVDRSEDMLIESRKRNPKARHICSCVSNLSIEERVDAVLIHDAVMYMTTEQQLKEMMECGYRHLRSGGMILVVPDVVKEYFSEHSLSGGAEDGEKSIQLLEWHWDRDASDQTYQLELSLLMREGSTIRAHHESHTLGLFSISQYTETLESVGFSIVEIEAEGRYFLAKK